jgi:hypothetical protein
MMSLNEARSLSLLARLRPMKLLAVLLIAAGAVAQTPQRAIDPPENHRPPIFFREGWKETPAATPVTPDHLTNPRLQLALYGPGKDGVKKSHHDSPHDDPYYIWLGECRQNCAITLRDKDSFVDLRGLANVRWRRLDIKAVVEGPWVENPNLSRVDEIGSTDLMVGGETPASSRLDWIEVYGQPVKRAK